MTATYAWADHRIFEAASRTDGKALLFGSDHASLFALDRSTRDVLVRWRGRETVDLREATGPEREILEALRDAPAGGLPAAGRVCACRSAGPPIGITMQTSPSHGNIEGTALSEPRARRCERSE